jgi:hypothetical protein
MGETASQLYVSSNVTTVDDDTVLKGLYNKDLVRVRCLIHIPAPLGSGYKSTVNGLKK